MSLLFYRWKAVLRDAAGDGTTGGAAAPIDSPNGDAPIDSVNQDAGGDSPQLEPAAGAAEEAADTPPRRPRGRPRKDGTPAGSPREGAPVGKPDAASGESTTPLLWMLATGLVLFLLARGRTNPSAAESPVLPPRNPEPATDSPSASSTTSPWGTPPLI